MNIRDKFTINENKAITPHYVVRYRMDSNDGDYVYNESEYDADEWKELPNFFFLMIAYLGKGYSGKFSHGSSWGSYYGHHWLENQHGLTEQIETFQDYYDIVSYGEFDVCHSYCGFNIEYYDENNRKFDVSIPNIDNLFNTEEEMIKAIKDACDEVVTADEETEGED